MNPDWIVTITLGSVAGILLLGLYVWGKREHKRLDKIK